MQKINKLNKRLSAIAEMVRLGKSVCDVGTDHAYLPCFLAKSGLYKKVYACDKNPLPLSRASDEIERQGANVTLIQSDGLENIPPCDDVIVAGMGGELIAEIIEKCHFKNKGLNLILQPMTRHEDLRKRLYKSGYIIIKEKTVEENNRLFIIINAVYTGEITEIDQATAMIGKSFDERYITSRLEMLEKMAKGNPAYNNLIKEIKENLEVYE